MPERFYDPGETGFPGAGGSVRSSLPRGNKPNCSAGVPLRIGETGRPHAAGCCTIETTRDGGDGIETICGAVAGDRKNKITRSAVRSCSPAQTRQVIKKEKRG